MIDLQGAQGSSRNRGIGRASLALAKALARHRGDHDVLIALNAKFADTIQPLRRVFASLLPPENIVAWNVPPEFYPAGNYREQRIAVELFYESALASLDPDFVLITSFFEGAKATTSLGRLITPVPTAVLLYDLIPLLYPDIYLKDAGERVQYFDKVKQLTNAALLLTISESAREEAVAHLGASNDTAVSILLGPDGHFAPAPLDDETMRHLAQHYGLIRPFVMYTGGFDERKNIRRLIEAFAALPTAVRHAHQLAIVCALRPPERAQLQRVVANAGLAQDEVILTGFVSEKDLLACYRACTLFAFPSWHEGFGLPALEAMMCGRAVIASNRSSLPEVIGNDRALFDPMDVGAIAAKLNEGLTDAKFRAELERHGLKQAKKFSWDVTAKRAWRALEAAHLRLNREQRAAPRRRVARDKSAVV